MVGCSQPESCGPWLYVQVEASHEQCPPAICLVTLCSSTSLSLTETVGLGGFLMTPNCVLQLMQ